MYKLKYHLMGKANVLHKDDSSEFIRDNTRLSVSAP